MNRAKQQGEHILWRAQMHLSHVRDRVLDGSIATKQDARNARTAHDFLRAFRAKMIVGSRRNVVIHPGNKPFTYWRNRPRATDSVPFEVS